MKVAILAPISTSLFSRIMTYTLSREPGIDLGVVIVRSPWSLTRLRSEFRRDGASLIRKVAQKMVLGDDRFRGDDHDTQGEIAREIGLPGRSLADLTRTLGVPLVTCDDHNSDRSIEALAACAPDVVVFTGGGLLRKRLLSIPRLGVLNCHPGMLPKFRGMDVVEWTALESGAGGPGMGLTVHFMDAGLDTGPILLTHPMSPRAGEGFARIRERMEHDAIECLMQAVRVLRDGTARPRSQAGEEGRQYYVMHPMLLEVADRRLRGYERAAATTAGVRGL